MQGRAQPGESFVPVGRFYWAGESEMQMVLMMPYKMSYAGLVSSPLTLSLIQVQMCAHLSFT